MRKTYLVTLSLLIACTIFYTACTKRYKQSVRGTINTHYPNSQCMNCHRPNGNAKQLFSVAGTILNEARKDYNGNAIIKLYTKKQGQGKLVGTIYTDKLGNFFTTKKIDFSKGLYPMLLGTPGVPEDTKYMNRKIYEGNCNGCHGFSAEALGID